MAWSRIDDGIIDHPKIAALGPIGFAWFVAGVVYANRNLTDGFVPFGVAPRLLPTLHVAANGDVIDAALATNEMVYRGSDLLVDMIIETLLAARVWTEVPGGYLIHDFTDWNMTRAEVLEIRDARIRAGQAGGQASAKARASANGQQTPKQTSSKRRSKTEAKSNPMPMPKPIEPKAKGAVQITDTQHYLMTRLHELEGWVGLTPAAIVKLNKLHDRQTVTEALQRAREENQPPKGSAYGLLAAMCKDIEKGGKVG